MRIGIVYWILATLIFFIGWDQFHFSNISTERITEKNTVGEITDGTVISQAFLIDAEQINAIKILFSTYNRKNSGEIVFNILDTDNHVIAQANIDIAQIVDGKYTTIPLDNIEIPENQTFILEISTRGSKSGNCVTIYSGDVVDTDSNETLEINGEIVNNSTLCAQIEGRKRIAAYQYYWPIIIGVFVCFGLYAYGSLKKAQHGVDSYLAAFCTLFTKYSFLVKQLVNRDFKTKYKRSFLGVAWSFLNPLLTMLVQYFVFSKIFTSNIENYSVYLLIGVVFMNFFSEATSLGLTAITGNASLIKKVYMPKYIYPICRVLSSLINFLFSMIPLILVMIITRTQFHFSLLLLAFDIICFVVFIIGMVLILSTSMTFFQDTQFLWNVISMMWMYLTPVFYPESIIPEQFLSIYHMNPMYQYITFARICIIDGVSPAPINYVLCIVSSILVLLCGIYFFKKYQDRFVLYI